MFSIEEKIGQMIVVGFHGLEPPAYLLDWLAAGRIGGVILFSRNVDTPAQLAELTRACHKAARWPILIGIDQEGGSVARLRGGFTESPGAMALGAAGSETLAHHISKMLATELRALGINWNYAPVVDITHDINNPSVGTRSLGTDKGQVSRLAVAEVRGFQEGGVAACANHVHGLGNTPIDTHLAMAVISGTPDYLWENDLLPFRAVVEAGVETVMVSHVKFEALDPQYPSTLSPIVADKLLREDVGFQGVTATDCMEMKAVADHYGQGEAAVLAALAGIDLILISHTRSHQEAVYQALVEAAHSGRLPAERIEAAVERVQRLKARYAVTTSPTPDLIRHPAHLLLAKEAARAGLVLLRADATVFPLRQDAEIGMVEFASYLESIAVEQGGATGFEQRLRGHLPHIQSVALVSDALNPAALAQARKIAVEADVLVVATRSAHLIPEQLELARELLSLAKRAIQVCLRNPYDVEALPGTGTVLCTCGDSTPSIEAAVDALLGQFTPKGRLPVPIHWKSRHDGSNWA